MEDHTINDLEAVLMRPISYSIEDHCVYKISDGCKKHPILMLGWVGPKFPFMPGAVCIYNF